MMVAQELIMVCVDNSVCSIKFPSMLDAIYLYCHAKLKWPWLLTVLNHLVDGFFLLVILMRSWIAFKVSRAGFSKWDQVCPDAKIRNLNDREMAAWMEARKLWDEKEQEKSSMLRHKVRVRVVKISGEDAGMLKGEIGEKGVWNAICGCSRDKAPGPDGEVLGDVQNAFIKGRSILNGVLIANETVEYLMKSKGKCLVFKKSASTSILVNGYPTKEFGLERGVRQGDPLSLFLFILEAEGLNALVSEAVEKGIFKGIAVGADRAVVSHLQYADDTIFFSEWSKENVKALMCILKCFEEVSGLKVNYNKSKEWFREPRGKVSGEMGGLMGFLQLVFLYNDRRDIWQWKFNEDEGFAVNIFVWRALKSSLPVPEELDKKGIDLDTFLCACCDSVVESCEHRLDMCSMAIAVALSDLAKWLIFSPWVFGGGVIIGCVLIGVVVMVDIPWVFGGGVIIGCVLIGVVVMVDMLVSHRLARRFHLSESLRMVGIILAYMFGIILGHGFSQLGHGNFELWAYRARMYGIVDWRHDSPVGQFVSVGVAGATIFHIKHAVAGSSIRDVRYRLHPAIITRKEIAAAGDLKKPRLPRKKKVIETADMKLTFEELRKGKTQAAADYEYNKAPGIKYKVFSLALNLNRLLVAEAQVFITALVALNLNRLLVAEAQVFITALDPERKAKVLPKIIFEALQKATENYTIEVTPDDRASVLQHGWLFVFIGKELYVGSTK
nr:cysteine-rich receptor-like protein kinase [Tanacetum cinerariifolium]